jgi:outer membrane protein
MRLLLAAFALVAVTGAANAQTPVGTTPPGPLTLQSAIELGRSRGVQATLARSAERIPNARVGPRRADLLPSVSAGATYQRQTLNLEEFGIASFTGVTDPFDLFNLQVRARQSIADPAAWARLHAAKDSAVASGLDARNAGALAGAAAGVAWLRVFAAEETVRARAADSITAVGLLDQSRRLLDAGVTAAIDLTRTEVTFGAFRSQLSVARNARDRARLDLARALDLPPGVPIAISGQPDTLGLPVFAHADSAVAFALRNRSDLAAEQKRLIALGEGRKAIRAENLPSLGATGYWQKSGRELSDLGSSWQVQVGLNIPILDGFRRQYRSGEQAARIEAQEIRVRDLSSQIDADARQALLDLASAEEQVAIARDREALAAQELRQAQDRFSAGVAGSLETSNAQLSLTAARDAAIQARVAWGVARVLAWRALGMIGPTEQRQPTTDR